MSNDAPKALEVVELHEAAMKLDDDGTSATTLAAPTQVRRPWRATVRTAFEAGVALLSLLPLVATDVYSSSDAYPAAVTQTLLVSAAAARVLANPAVESFLQRFVPWLAAAPRPTIAQLS